MARNKEERPVLTVLELVVSKMDAEEKIQNRIDKGNELHKAQINSWEQLEATKKDYYKWSDYNSELLKRLFTNDTLADEYIGFFGAVVGGATPSLSEEVHDLRKRIQEKIHRLESIKERIELIPSQAVNPCTSKAAAISNSATNKIFIVHGHDEGARESVARYLEKLGLSPIILHEQANGGRTIIEKLEHNSDVDFAVVLLTPDDVGTVATAADKLNPRARQNVILELGFFAGKLGRSRVCALHKGTVELPSDVLGVVYVGMDIAGGWRLLLAKELREAGFEVDLNLAM